MDAESAAAVTRKLKTAKVPYVLDDGGRADPRAAPSASTSCASSSRRRACRRRAASASRSSIARRSAPPSSSSSQLPPRARRRARAHHRHDQRGGERARAHRDGEGLAVHRPRRAGEGVGRVLKLRNNTPLAPATVKRHHRPGGGERRIAASGIGRHPRQLRPSAVAPAGHRGRRGLGAAQIERQQRHRARHGDAGRGAARAGRRRRPRPRQRRGAPEGRLARGNRGDAGIRRRSSAAARRRPTADGAHQRAGRRRRARAICRPPVTTSPTGAASDRRRRPAPRSSAETTNYEVSKLTRHTHRAARRLARLSVAVHRSTTTPCSAGRSGADTASDASADAARSSARTPEELQRFSSSSPPRSASTTTRGDQLTVENIAFDEPPIELRPTERRRLDGERFGPAGHVDASASSACSSLALRAASACVRPMVRTAAASAGERRLPAAGRGRRPVRAPSGPRTVARARERDRRAARRDGGDQRLPVLTRRVASSRSKEPEQRGRSCSAAGSRKRSARWHVR